jgi:hypothetical protein
MKASRKEIQDANELIRLMWHSLSSHLQYRFRHAIGTIECAIDEIHELKEEPMNQLIEDQIVIRVLSRFAERSQVGINKYKTTLERTDLSTLEWLTHAQEEAMDFVLYLERLKDEYRGDLLTKMIKQSEQDGLYEDKLKRTMPK